MSVLRSFTSIRARGADTMITRAIDAHADAELHRDDGDSGSAGGLVPVGQWHLDGTFGAEELRPPVKTGCAAGS